MTNPVNESEHLDPQQWFDRFQTYPSSRTALNLAGAYRKMVVGIDDVTVEATIDQVREFVTISDDDYPEAFVELVTMGAVELLNSDGERPKVRLTMLPERKRNDGR